MSIDLTGGYDEEFERVWRTQPDNPELRESVNAWIWDDQLTIGLPRCGVEAVADQWETHDIQINVACRRRPGVQRRRARARSTTRSGPTGRCGSSAPARCRSSWSSRSRTGGCASTARSPPARWTAQIGGEFPGQGERVPMHGDDRPALRRAAVDERRPAAARPSGSSTRRRRAT